MISFSYYLKAQMERHPSMQPRDVAKLCYQAAFGAEHLLQDPLAARRYLERELETVSADASAALMEEISHGICHVNLKAWKHRDLPVDWLFSMFVASATVAPSHREALDAYLRTATDLVTEGVFGFSAAAWNRFLQEYTAAGRPAVHHSDLYREKERPAYRIVRREYASLLPLLERVAQIRSAKGACVIAIDGRAAAGKTTLAARLQTVFGVDVIHMDDFFLPPALRTPARLEEPGGNLHYERVVEEVLPHLSTGNALSYGIFDCGTMSLSGQRTIAAAPIRVVEGSYSHHPVFGAYADLRVFVTVSPEEQMERILCRNGEGLAKRFREEWIPMEERYFAAFEVEAKADIVI